MWKYTIILVLAILVYRNTDVDAVCNRCKDGFTCLNEKDFQLCFNNQPNTSKTYTCQNEDEICSQYGRICMPRNRVSPACRGMQNCVCDNVADFQFVCTSRTTFTMCLDQKFTTTRGSCPKNLICDVVKGRNGEIPCTKGCLDEVSDALLCDFENPVDLPEPEPVTPIPTPITEPPVTETPVTETPAPVTPTPTPVTEPPVTETPVTETPAPVTPTPTPVTETPITETPVTPTPVTPTPVTPTPTPVTPTPTPVTPTPTPVTPTPTVKPTTVTQPTTVVINPTPSTIENQFCANQAAAGRYPYPNDRRCKDYIFCFKNGNQWVGSRRTCPPRKFFDRDVGNCVDHKPRDCR